MSRFLLFCLIHYLCSISQVALSSHYSGCSDYITAKDLAQEDQVNRYVPVALLTNTAQHVGLSDTIIEVSKTAVIKFTNTGTNLQSTVPPNSCTIRGGIFGNMTYYLSGIIIRWDAHPTATRNVGTQDGVGYFNNIVRTPIAVNFDFLACGYSNPLNQSDGLARIRVNPVVVGSGSSPYFAPIATQVFANTRQYNTSASILLRSFTPWVLNSLKSRYFAYAASSVNVATKQQTPNAVEIVAPYYCQPYVTFCEFYDYFLTLRNSFNQPVVQTLDLYDQAARKLLEVDSCVKVKYCNTYPTC